LTPIYHITHLGNLPLIFEQNGLWCDSERLTRNLNVTGIAHQHIKDRRAKKRVPVAATGAVADYVPFYFGPRSPMLCAIHHGKVEGCEGGQQRVLHLVSNVEAAMALDTPWCFTDGQAEMGPTLFYDDWAEKDRVDWQLMQATWWNDTAEFPDRSRRRQAEFLVHRFFPWSAIEFVGVYDKAIAVEVEAVLEAATHRPTIRVQPDWYY
jgi:hypothetical protein